MSQIRGVFRLNIGVECKVHTGQGGIRCVLLLRFTLKTREALRLVQFELTGLCKYDSLIQF